MPIDRNRVITPTPFDTGKTVSKTDTQLKTELKIYEDSWVLITTDPMGNKGAAAFGPLGSLGIITQLMENGGAVRHDGVNGAGN